MADRQIPAYCLANTAEAACVKVGVNIPELDIREGDSLDYVIERLASNSIAVEDSTANQVNANLHCLGGSGNSLCAAAVSVRTLRYSCTPDTGGGVDFTWDMNSIKEGLPPGYSIITSSTVINGSKAVLPLLSSPSLKSSLFIQNTEYPVTADFKVRISTPCGQIELSKTVSLFNASDRGEKIAIMSLRDFTAQSIQDITPNQYYELVAMEICSVKDRLVLLEQIPDLNATITSLNQKIASLEAEIAQLKG